MPPGVSSFWPHLESFPPIKVRLLAHRPLRSSTRTCLALTDAEVAIASGLELDRVRQISRMLDWANVRVGEMKAFCAACRFDPTIAQHRQRLVDYESKCLARQSQPFQWIHRSPVFESEFLPLIKKLGQTASPRQHVA